jgi:hypothetical protein
LVQPAACAGLLGNASLLIATYGKIRRITDPGRIDADVWRRRGWPIWRGNDELQRASTLFAF